MAKSAGACHLGYLSVCQSVASNMGCGGSKSEPEGATPEEELKELHQKVLAAESKAKEEAAKTLTEQMANAKPLTGDLDGLKEAIKAAQAVKLPASELAFPLATLEEMEELHDAMNNAISQLTEVARGVDIRLGVIGLEELVAERKAPLNKFTDVCAAPPTSSAPPPCACASLSVMSLCAHPRAHAGFLCTASSLRACVRFRRTRSSYICS